MSNSAILTLIIIHIVLIARRLVYSSVRSSLKYFSRATDGVMILKYIIMMTVFITVNENALFLCGLVPTFPWQSFY